MSSEEQIMSKDEYSSIFLCKMVAAKIFDGLSLIIDHFTVGGLVTWPLNDSEAGVDLVLIQTSLLFLCKSSCSYAN